MIKSEGELVLFDSGDKQEVLFRRDNIYAQDEKLNPYLNAKEYNFMSY